MRSEDANVEAVVEAGVEQLDVENVVDAVVYCSVQLVAVFGQTCTQTPSEQFQETFTIH